MAETPFDVNDAELRERFLRQRPQTALAGLSDDSAPRWGRMTAQQMVEHLLWAVELSTGDAETECPVPESERGQMKRFLYSNHPTPHEFMNPALVSGLPPLRYASLAQATSALLAQVSRFLETPETGPRTHPVFGPIGHEEWHRAHYKHLHHHFCQFGLIEESSKDH